MRLPFGKQFDKTNALVAIGVFAITLVVYVLTKAPTLSFWDCGEFIAASHILGVPHPPGYPLYTLVGRLFSITPLSADIAVRVNLLSSICNAFAAFFGYLATVRVLRLWYGPDRSPYTRLLIYAGAASGALFLAFGLTQWINSVEAEVYGMTMLLFTAVLWLTLIYYENRGTPLADRVLLLIVYLATLGIGVHLTAFMILVVSSLVFILHKDTPAKFWFIVGAFFVLELYLVFALSSRPDEVPYYVPVAIVAAFYAFYVFSFDRIPGRLLLFGAGFLVAIAPLYYVLIRALSPAVGDHGDGAETLTASLTWLGILAMAGLSVYALYFLYHYRRSSRKVNESARHTFVACVFVPAAAVMSLILVMNIRGYHAFLVISGLCLIGLLALMRRYVNWSVLVAVAGVSFIIIGVKEFIIGMSAAVVLIFLIGAKHRFGGMRLAAMVILIATVGYSVHLYLPVRSTQQPMINQNNPSKDLKTVVSFLERKQYGAQSMIERMFKRRGEWGNQFGDYQRMGFWHFLHRQYGLVGPKFFILFVLGLFGVWEIARRRPSVGVMLLILLLICSVGLVLYMNFADGVRQDPVSGRDHIEVRDRDYFFTPFFVVFGLAIGMGITVFVEFVRSFVAHFTPGVRKLILTCLPVLFLLPGYALAGNYHRCDRSRNYIPFDYARNILISCEPNAILFTGGDNDTFPLWCLQEVYGVRTDVKVVCLPLANTKWYIKQLRDNMGLNLGWTDRDIDQLVVYRLSDGSTLSLQDQVINALVDNNRYAWPIHFSLTVGVGGREYNGRSADSLLEQIGMVYRFKNTADGMTIDVDRSIELFTDPDGFRYRGMNDPTVYKDDATVRQARNIAKSMLRVTDALRRGDDLQRAVDLTRFVVDRIPQATEALPYLAGLLLQQGRLDELEELIITVDSEDVNRLRVLLARALRQRGDLSRAEIQLKGAMQVDPAYRPAFEELTRLYFAEKQFANLEELFRNWLITNPDDSQVTAMLQQLQQQRNASEE
jgi:hypothetical protein